MEEWKKEMMQQKAMGISVSAKTKPKGSSTYGGKKQSAPKGNKQWYENKKNVEIDRNRSFLNPYNFVDLSFEKSEKTRSLETVDNTGEKLSGVLKCKLKTKTKLFVPESNAEDPAAEHKTYAFMKNWKGEYIIPGSSLRGVIRSAFEAATDSCFSTLTNSKLLSGRYKGNGTIVAGILKKERGKWVLYSADELFILTVVKDNPKEKGEDKDYMVSNVSYKYGKFAIGNDKSIELKNGNKLYTGDRVTVKGKFKSRESNNSGVPPKTKIVSEIAGYEEKSDDKNEDYIFIGEEAVGRHYSRIFRKKEKIFEFDIDSAEIKGLIKIFKDYGDNKVNKNHYSKDKDGEKKKKHTGYEYLKLNIQNNDFENKVIPLWYEKSKEEAGDRYYLQLAAKGRRAYYKTLNDFIPEKDEIHKPCSQRKRLCEACLLFGMVGKEKDTEALGSRVRFTDAIIATPEKIIDKKNKNEWRTLEILSTPHVYLPFFVKDDKVADAVLKNADYDKIADLRGRKFYLHAPKKTFEMINKKGSIKKSNQNITAQIANEEAEFGFDIYFDRISDNELKKLIWSLNFWENDLDGTYCHKIGHGKPIGMGSAKIVIESIVERKYANGLYEEKKSTFEEYFKEDDDPFKEAKENNAANVKRLADYDEMCKRNILIHYPGWKEIDNDEGFEWFSNNTSAVGKKDSKMQRLGNIYSPLYEWK